MCILIYILNYFLIIESQAYDYGFCSFQLLLYANKLLSKNLVLINTCSSNNSSV